MSTARTRRMRLTDRQREVLTLVANGLDNNEIAQKLHISSHTVEDILVRAYENLGLPRNRRAHAVAVAMALGEILSRVIDIPDLKQEKAA